MACYCHNHRPTEQWRKNRELKVSFRQKKKKEKNQQEQQETTRNISFVDKVGPLALSMGKHTTGYLLI